MSKILVTGGAGFIGSNLVDELVSQGHEVLVIDNLFSGKEEYLNTRAKFFRVDICDPELERIFSQETQEGKIDFIFHLAAQINVGKSVADPVEDNRINVLGGLNVLENCRKFGVKKIVFASTGGAIYGQDAPVPTKEDCLPAPISPYGIHKLTFEKYLNYYRKVFGQDYTVLRFANVYGPRQFKGGESGVIANFVDNAVNGIKSTINGDGSQTRDFVYVGDVVRALIKALETDYAGEINIGCGQEINILSLVEAVEAALGKKIVKEHGPAKAGEQMRSCLDCTLAEKILAWRPQTCLEQGIKETMAWSMENLIKKKK